MAQRITRAYCRSLKGEPSVELLPQSWFSSLFPGLETLVLRKLGCYRRSCSHRPQLSKLGCRSTNRFFGDLFRLLDHQLHVLRGRGKDAGRLSLNV